MKIKIVVSAMLLIAIAQLPLSAGTIREGRQFLTGQLMVLNHSTLIGINFEHCLSPYVGLGIDIAFFLEDDSGLYLSPDLSYHFKTNEKNLDVMVGAGPALVIAFGGGSDFRFKLFGGARYFFSPKWAGYVKILFDIGDDSGMGGAFGVSYKLK